MNAEDMLASLGVTLEEVVKADEDLRSRPAVRDGRICVCGHGVSRHTTDEALGVSICKPSRMDCPCRTVRPVIEAEDTRPFLRKTQGPGAAHALTRGIAALAIVGKKSEWIIPMICDRCSEPSEELVPVPVTASGVASDEATGYDKLLCPSCRLAVG